MCCDFFTPISIVHIIRVHLVIKCTVEKCSRETFIKLNKLINFCWAKKAWATFPFTYFQVVGKKCDELKQFHMDKSIKSVPLACP